MNQIYHFCAEHGNDDRFSGLIRIEKIDSVLDNARIKHAVAEIWKQENPHYGYSVDYRNFVILSLTTV